MSLKHHFELLAVYNQWMNSKIYRAASALSDSELAEDRGAFFGSILGTLNHLMVGDTFWLKLFAVHSPCAACLHEIAELPDPSSLDQIVFKDFTGLSERRYWMDRVVVGWVAQLSEDDFDAILRYHNTTGVPCNKRFSSLLLHFFNHQTHHRGQVSTLLSQAGQDVGVTDLLAQIPEESPV